jgi:hypothetical protein
VNSSIEIEHGPHALFENRDRRNRKAGTNLGSDLDSPESDTASTTPDEDVFFLGSWLDVRSGPVESEM